MSRCVRQAFLCGEDAYSGRSYEHRKGWVRERLRELAALFAIDVCAYAVMSNHLHVVLRVAAERAAAWSNEEVARRYTTLHPMAVAQMTLDDYRRLLAWTASARSGSPPKGPPPPILVRRGLNPAARLRTLDDARVETATFLGSPETVTAHAEAHGQAWHRGIGLARDLAAA